MLSHKGYKYRIYPNKGQTVLLAQFFGCCRFVYNHFLALQKALYREEKTSYSYNQMAKAITAMRKEISWLNEADSIALQESVKDLSRAYTNFFEKRAKYPRFHKKSFAQSYRTRNQNNCIRIEGNYIVLPKLGKVKAKISRLPKGRILNATVRRTPTGKYFVSLCCEEELIPKENQGGEVGLDFGIKQFCTYDSGEREKNPKHIKQKLRKLKREQRKFSRKKNGSSNRKKQRIRVAAVHEQVANARGDFLHKLSHKLVSENQVIGLEDVRINDLLLREGAARKRHNINRAYYDVGWNTFVSMLAYKGEEYGCDVIKAPEDFPSTRMCNKCGHVEPAMDLSIQRWVCPECGAHHDRHQNAAVNILNYALGTVGHTGTGQ